MDRKTLWAFIFIGMILIFTPYYFELISPKKPISNLPKSSQDSLKVASEVNSEQNLKKLREPQQESVMQKLNEEAVISIPQTEKKFVTIETDLYKAVFSSVGGGSLVSWELKNFDFWSGGKVNLISIPEENLGIRFYDPNNKLIDLSKYNFEIINYKKSFTLNKESGSQEIIFRYQIEPGKFITKKFRFTNELYSFDMEVKFENTADLINNREYEVFWKKGIALTEQNIEIDLTYTYSCALMGDEIENFDISEEQETKFTPTGETKWIAVRNKYFLTAIIPVSQKGKGVYCITKGKKLENKSYFLKDFDIALEIPSYNEGEFSKYSVYLGPIDNRVLEKYETDLEGLVLSSNWYERFFRPFSMIILPAVLFLNSFIPNWGIVIIVFSILIKILLHPLTKKSFASMKEMQILQPKVAELREKHKKDPQKLNQEIMKLYKEHGVNPMGGCLPMLLQMPILTGLFVVFNSTIQLRGAEFMLWIKDLSQPDTLFYLPFSLPFYGNSFNLLPILMGVTSIIQSKGTATDPTQKFMIYFMPIFLVFLLNQFPSGLMLYYTVYNVLTIIQQKWLTKAPESLPVKTLPQEKKKFAKQLK